MRFPRFSAVTRIIFISALIHSASVWFYDCAHKCTHTHTHERVSICSGGKLAWIWLWLYVVWREEEQWWAIVRRLSTSLESTRVWGGRSLKHSTSVDVFVSSSIWAEVNRLKVMFNVSGPDFYGRARECAIYYGGARQLPFGSELDLDWICDSKHDCFKEALFYVIFIHF